MSETQVAETTVTTSKSSVVVIMKDGRKVDFGVRGKLKKTVEFIGEGTERVAKLVIDVINGDTFTAEVGFSDALLLELAAHGLSQKITDSLVKADDPDDIAVGVEAQINQIKNGVWSQRASGESVFRGFSDLLEAIRRLKGYEVGSEQAANLKTNLAARSEAEIKNFKSNHQIKAVLATIASEKAAARAAKLSSAPAPEADAADALVDL